MPADLLANLAMGMSVEVFSESCRLHLGLSNCTQHAMVYPGDTLRNHVEVVGVQHVRRMHTKPGSAVVESRHTRTWRSEPNTVYKRVKDERAIHANAAITKRW